MRKRYSKTDALLAVGIPSVNGLYHVQWGKSNGVVGRVVSVDDVNKTVVMASPKTRIKWKNLVKWDDLRYTRKAQYKIETSKQ